MEANLVIVGLNNLGGNDLPNADPGELAPHVINRCIDHDHFEEWLEINSSGTERGAGLLKLLPIGIDPRNKHRYTQLETYSSI